VKLIQIQDLAAQFDSQNETAENNQFEPNETATR
jgi:hypothetical protein